MSVEIDIQGDKKIMDALSSLSDKEIARAAVAAGKAGGYSSQDCRHQGNTKHLHHEGR